MMRAIASKFEFAWPPSSWVKHADACALYIERKALFPFPVGTDIPEAHPWLPVYWDFDYMASRTPEQLERLFLSRFHQYRDEVKIPVGEPCLPVLGSAYGIY